ncbi:CRISPR-associated protein Cas1, partial [mine drainage metagenome]
MTTLYLDRKGLELRPDGEALALYEGGSRVRSIPLALLDRVVIRAETMLTSGVPRSDYRG